MQGVAPPPPELARLAEDLDLALYVMQLEPEVCAYVSPGLDRLLAFPGQSQSSADPVLRWCHEDDRSALMEALSSLRASGVAAGLRLRVGFEGGSYLAVRGRWALVALDGRSFAVGVITQESADSVLEGDRLGQLSHDLRTPLNAVLGYAQLLGLGDLDPDQRNSVDQIVTGGRRLLALIETLENAGAA